MLLNGFGHLNICHTEWRLITPLHPQTYIFMDLCVFLSWCAIYKELKTLVGNHVFNHRSSLWVTILWLFVTVNTCFTYIRRNITKQNGCWLDENLILLEQKQTLSAAPYCPGFHHNKSMIGLQRLGVLTGKPRSDTLAPYRKQASYVSSTVFFPPFGWMNVFTLHIVNFMFYYIKHETVNRYETCSLMSTSHAV